MANWEVLEIEPTPARGKFRDELFDDPNWAAELKKDGDRRTGQFYWGVPDQGMTMYQIPKVYFAGRTVSKITGKLVEKGENVPHITRGQTAPNWGFDSALMERMLRLTGTVLDGECEVPEGFVLPDDDPEGNLVKYVQRVTGCNGEGAAQRALEKMGQDVEDGGVGGKLRWCVFDILYYMGRDLRHLPLAERRKWLIEAVGVLGNPYVYLVPHITEDKRGFLRNVLADGGEGVILKDLRAPRDDKAHLTWVKKKFELFADVIIIGFQPPKQFSKKVTGEVSETKFWKQGLIGAVEFGQYKDGVIWPCGTMAGMTDKLRQDLTDHQTQYMGRVVEVKANGREHKTMAFQHPRWKRLRDDKRPEDCIYNENES